jgi:cytochrome c553
MLNIDQTFGCAEFGMRGVWLRPVLGLWIPWLLAAGATSAPASAVAASDEQPANGKLEAEQEEFFEAKVRPLLVAHCLECHGVDKHKAGLRLDRRDVMLKGSETGPVVVPGKPDLSPLIEAIRYEGDVQMPPKGKLKDHEIAALTEWVKRGAIWPEPRRGLSALAVASSTTGASPVAASARARARSFWSFQPVADPVPPAVANDAWPSSPIDRFILAKLEQNGLSPAPPADRPTLIRRASFDLIGLPPTVEDIDTVVRDQAPGAFGRVVDRLLASPHYGERWGRYWLDLARYGEDQAHSFQPRLYPGGFRYRDWLVRAINGDMPYDRFITEQIAGDLLDGPDRLGRLAALGFFACGPVYYGDRNKLDQYADRIDTLTRSFLGLTVACARCHDHKYDPIPTADYYALAGVFASTEYVEAPVGRPEQIEAYNKAQAGIQAKDREITSFLKAQAERLKQKTSVNQLKQVERLLPADARAKLKVLRAELVGLKKKAPPKYPVVHTLGEAPQATEMHVLLRGNPEAPGPKVPRRFLSILGGEGSPFQYGSGRLELARAVASAENPLTARVMVNRIWQHHFGRGLVGTSSNFGALGQRPSHPELLDWLAHRFAASGWSQKTLHRAIMLSAVYQQSSRLDSEGFAKDPENTLLWRMNRRRLDVEAWRDAMLAVAGRLDARLGGPSVGLDAPGNERRTFYAAISRHDLAWMLRLFDFPDPNITSGGRVETTVPLQQLFALNSEFMAASARAVAARLRAASQPGRDDAERIKTVYLLLFGRSPTEHERQLGLAYLRAYEPAAARAPGSGAISSRWERYTHALLATNEFAFID